MKHGRLPADISRKAGQLARQLTDLGTYTVLACSDWHDHDFAEVGAKLEEITEDVRRIITDLDQMTRQVYALLGKEKAGTTARL